MDTQAGLAAGESRDHVLALRGGDFVSGDLQADSNAPSLWLLGPAGDPVRRLLEPGMPGDFMFLASRDGAYRLRVDAQDVATTYRLRIDRQLPKDRQLAPPAAPRSPRLRALHEQLGEGGDTSAFWAQVRREGTPLIETVDGKILATFLWRGAQRNVRLFAAPTGDIEDLQRLGDSDVWFGTWEVPADTRMAYQLAPDVPAMPEGGRDARRAILSTVQRDPLNPRFWPEDAPDDFSRESILELPAAPESNVPVGRVDPAGLLQRLEVTSRRLGNTRAVDLYRSPGYQAGDPRNAMLLVFDGHYYQTLVPTPQILDQLAARGAIPPMLVLLVSNPDADARARELPCNPEFGDFLVRELLPLIEREAGKLPPAQRTALAGASYGGLASACVALQHPARFGNVISQSGSFWWSPSPQGRATEQEPVWLARRISRLPPQPVRFWLEAGRFERGGADGPGILESNRHLRDVLQAKGYDVRHREFSGGHDWYAWRHGFAEGVLAIFGASPPLTPSPADASVHPTSKDD